MMRNVLFLMECPTMLIGEAEACRARKTGGFATGTWGTVSWDVNGKERIVIMWSAPFNHNHHTNVLAVGTTDTETLHNKYVMSALHSARSHSPSIKRNTRHCPSVRQTTGAHWQVL